MKKFKYILILSLLLIPFGFANAANDVTVSANTTIELTSPASMSLTLASGSSYSSMTVSASSISFTISAGGSITLTSADGYYIKNDRTTVSCSGTTSSVTYSLVAGASDDTITFTPTDSVVCTASGSTLDGGSSGGSGSSTSSTASSATGTQSVSKTVSGSGGGSVATTDNKAGMQIPVGLASGNVSMNITPKASSGYTTPTGKYKALANQVYDFSLSSGGSAITSLSNSATLTFKYTNSDVSGLNPDSLTVYYWDTTSSSWVALNTTVDKDAKTVTAGVTHFTLFGVFGEQAPITVEGINAGDLVKVANNPAVYYIGSDSKRYIFPNLNTYKTWYSDFSAVKTISQTEMQALDEFGGNITFRAGTKLIKFPTVPKVYAVEPGGVLRHIDGEAIAESLYGAEWWKWVWEVAEENYISYTIGADITEAKYPVGSLIKYANSSDKYYMNANGIKRLLTNSGFSNNRFHNDFVIETNIVYSDGAQITGEESDLSTTAGP